MRYIASAATPKLFCADSRGSIIFSSDVKIAFVFQEPLILEWKTVKDNIEFGLRASGAARQDYEYAENLIERFRLSQFRYYYPYQLSRGMKQLVALARALVLRPTLLLMDEPLSSLDALTRHLLQDFVIDIAMENTVSAILVTHSMEEAAYCADRILLLSSRPARIEEEHKVPFPRPRKPSLRNSQEFREFETALYQRIRSFIPDPLV